jgi:hypothetical protein
MSDDVKVGLRGIHKRNLASAVFSYLDDEDDSEGIFNLLKDLKDILDEEEDCRQREIEKVKVLRHFLFDSTFIGENNASENQGVD